MLGSVILSSRVDSVDEMRRNYSLKAPLRQPACLPALLLGSSEAGALLFPNHGAPCQHWAPSGSTGGAAGQWLPLPGRAEGLVVLAAVDQFSQVVH